MLGAEGGLGRRKGLGGGEKGEVRTKEEGAEEEGLGKGWRGRELRKMKNGYKGGGLRGFLRQRETERGIRAEKGSGGCGEKGG